jgi:hypothetical protein
MTSLIYNGLFEEALLKPIERGATSLNVVTGYASPAMISRHLDIAKERYKIKVDLDLLVGMTGRDGLSRTSLLGFRSIRRQIPGNDFRCSFSTKPTSIHSKVFVWSNESGPVQAFIGSANYTQAGFGLSSQTLQHHEVLVEVDAHEAFDYAITIASSTIDVNHPDIASYIDIFDVDGNSAQEGQEEATPTLLGGAQSVLLPLVQVKRNPGHVHNAGGGLNWGQRGTRNRNEAYLPIPISVQNANFFPPKGEHFQVITDDGESFIATTAQEGGKAIETPNDNSILGKYFRRRLGVQSGAFVQTEDLGRFGSNAVEFTAVEPGLYYLDFRPGLNVEL